MSILIFFPCCTIFLGLSEDNKVKIIMSLALAFHDFPGLVITARTHLSLCVFFLDVICKWSQRDEDRPSSDAAERFQFSDTASFLIPRFLTEEGNTLAWELCFLEVWIITEKLSKLPLVFISIVKLTKSWENSMDSRRLWGLSDFAAFMQIRHTAWTERLGLDRGVPPLLETRDGGSRTASCSGSFR